MMKNGPHNPIIARENSSVKYLRSLADPKRRKETGFSLIEGIKMVEEALQRGTEVKTVVAAPSLSRQHGKGILKMAESRSVEVLWISEKVLDSVSESKTPQPVMAVVAMPKYREEEILSHPSKLIVIAHQLQDPGNLGTIIRTAEAVGAAGVAVTTATVDPFHAKAIRASMGSILRVPVARIKNAAEFLGKCKEAGFQTMAMVLRGEKSLFDIDLRKPTAVIVGQEGSGLSEDIVQAADQRVHIPMAETIDSLNVATSAAVILYEAMRQRHRR